MSLNVSEIAAIMPIAIPAGAACLLPIATLDKDQATMKWIRGAVFGIALLALGWSFHLVTRLWGVGYQPSWTQLRMDLLGQFAAIFVLVAAAVTVLQLWDHLHQEGWVKGEVLSLLLFSVTGMLVFACTTHLVVMFLGLELLSIPLYALTASTRMRSSAPEGGVKYFLTGAVAAACFLMGSVLLYGLTGSLDLVQIAGSLRTSGDALAMAAMALLVFGFLFKVSAVPFHQWTPDVYEAAPHPITAFMSVATKGVALIALLRAFPWALSATADADPRLKTALALVAGLSMVVGNLSALPQTNLKRMLAYSSISHAGYLLLGFVAGTSAALGGVLFYLVAYLAMNLGAFGLLSALGLVGERTTFEDLRGLGWKRPVLGISAALCFLSLAGIPPTGGFFGKYLIFKELIATGHVGLAVLGVLASLVSVYYYLRVLVALFLEAPRPQAEREAQERPAVHAPLASATVYVCGLLTLAVGLFQGLVFNRFALRAIQETMR